MRPARKFWHLFGVQQVEKRRHEVKRRQLTQVSSSMNERTGSGHEPAPRMVAVAMKLTRLLSQLDTRMHHAFHEVLGFRPLHE